MKTESREYLIQEYFKCSDEEIEKLTHLDKEVLFLQIDKWIDDLELKWTLRP